MSVEVMNWVFRNAEATGNDRLVLLAIADEADDDGTNAFPSIDRIALKARVPKRTVMRCLTRLEETEALVVHRPEVRGRGHFNTYVVVMEKGVTVAPDAGRETARKGAERRATTANPSQTHRPIDITPESQKPPSTAEAADHPQAHRLCVLLAELSSTHREVEMPKVTPAWVKTMRLLLERGSAGWATPKVQDPDYVERLIRFTFGRLNVQEGSGKFCWADVIRSPDSFRKHYDDLVSAARRLQQGTGPSKGAQTIDRVARRLIAEEQQQQRPNLALLPPANHGGA